MGKLLGRGAEIFYLQIIREWKGEIQRMQQFKYWLMTTSAFPKATLVVKKS